MPDAGFPAGRVRGVPVVTAPEEIDITTADGLRAAPSTASPSSPRMRISPGSPASHGSIPSPPRPHDDFTIGALASRFTRSVRGDKSQP